MKELENHHIKALTGVPVYLQEAERNSVMTDWGVSVVMAPLIWKKTKGEGIKVAVFDTGIEKEHTDLRANLKGGINFTSNDRDDWTDRSGHGTHVAGIIGASDRVGVGIIGIAPRVDLYAVKVLGDNGEGRLDWIAKGIEWAIENKMDIINMSLGTTVEPPASFQAFFKRAEEAGIPIIAATGNENTKVGWPAAYKETISVAAISSALERAAFSNFGPETDIAAPGVDIYSTYLNNTHAKLSGTSMATPMVTGSVALLLARVKNTGDSISIHQLRASLQQASVDLGLPGKDAEFGAGLINLSRLIR